MKRKLRFLLVTMFGICANGSMAQDVRITADMDMADFTVGGRSYTIARNQDTSNRLNGELTRTSRPCPDFCIQPMRAAPGVQTLGELEVIALLQSDVSDGEALLVDARSPAEFAIAAVPGAVNIPLEVVRVDNPYRGQIFQALGGRPDGIGFDFSDALELVVYGDGPWNAEAAEMIRELIDAGYPAAKLGYYRGGMQGWQGLGLTVAETASGG
jgi:rhodanese-related sulfurtransferase